MTNPYEMYMESSVLTATPVELVAMLYRCAIDSIADARRCLQRGDIAGRVHPINRAFDAISELVLSLDLQQGGDLSRNLSDLYGYISHKVILGHSQASDEALGEAQRLLTTLLEAWDQVATAGTRG